MKHKQQEKQAQQLLDAIQQTLTDALIQTTKYLDRLEGLLTDCREAEETFKHNQELHQLDPLRGDYQHRPNGKRPVSGRFRYRDEMREVNEAEWIRMQRRASRRGD